MSGYLGPSGVGAGYAAGGMASAYPPYRAEDIPLSFGGGGAPLSAQLPPRAAPSGTGGIDVEKSVKKFKVGKSGAGCGEK